MITPNMKDNSKCLVFENLGSAHLQIVGEFAFYPSRYRGSVPRTSWKFRKEKKIRIPDFMSLSNHVSTETELNLKNQIVSVQGVADLISPFGIDFGTQQFLLPRNPIESKTFSNLPFSQSVLKAEDKDKF
ncbi:hypothetical protein CDAR_72031 [Caerostris darwini]|uniref:Ribosomal protein L5 n=1 Tax=Caerostris darwini TaxID=1538125 RepID=A0AAV4SD21_9ARAC|nr:hypothetical protein CDAR_72031 [Caerostris darwini]